MLRILLIDDDTNFAPSAAALIKQEGFEVALAASLAEARRVLEEFIPDLVLVDMVLPDGNGLDLAKDSKKIPKAKFVLITGHASVDSAIEAMRARVIDYLVKPLDIDHLRRLLRRVDLEANHQDVSDILNDAPYPVHFGPLVGASDAMKSVYELIEKVAPTEATVFIQGESGSGKELVGRAIYEMSRRSSKPFLALNCGALSATLVGSELFGHERGSFTGAMKQHRGYFERANGGTLFLDEVTEMPSELQTHLLRVLETKSVVRLGGDREIPVDVRVIAATNRQPEKLIAQGKFRKDLFFRLAGFPISVPPLRERGSDINLLARLFLGQMNKSYSGQKTFAESALQRLNEHNWPGNVRELKNVIESAYIMAGNEITAADIPDWSVNWKNGSTQSPDFKVGTTLDDVERELLYTTLRYFNGDKKKTAQSLGISLKTIYNRLARYETA